MATSLDTKNQAFGATNPLTLSYTVGVAGKLLVVGLGIGSTTARAGGAVTFNAVAMTQAGSTLIAAAEVGCELWYMLNPPTGAAYNISVPNTGLLNIRLMASSYVAGASGFALDVINGQTGTTANPSTSVTTLGNNDIVADIMASSNNNAETGRNQTLLYSNDEGLWNDSGQYAINITPQTIAFTHTIAASNWAQQVASFKDLTPMSLANFLMMMGVGQ